MHELEEQGRAHDARETDRSRKFLNLEPETAQLVSMLARGSRATRVLEIGTSNGYSTIWLAASVAPAEGRVITIDRSAEKQKMARENLAKAGLAGFRGTCVAETPRKLSRRCQDRLILCFSTPTGSAPTNNWPCCCRNFLHQAFLLADNALSHPAEIADYLAAIQELRRFQHALIPVGKGLSVALTGSRWNSPADFVAPASRRHLFVAKTSQSAAMTLGAIETS